LLFLCPQGSSNESVTCIAPLARFVPERSEKAQTVTTGSSGSSGC